MSISKDELKQILESQRAQTDQMLVDQRNQMMNMFKQLMEDKAGPSEVKKDELKPLRDQMDVFEGSESSLSFTD
uniref:Uncharacterized protein n=1 Tax=Panagrolaimus sp. JU765 TaxID=591449 RepID=A0AC34Q9D3_9BILA